MSRTLGMFMLLTIGLFAPSLGAQPDRPLPLDPLTPRERALADTVVRADARVREFLAGGQSRLINIDFISVKLAGDSAIQDNVPSRRTAEALLYRYDLNQGLRVLVDVGRRTIIEVARVPGESVPINGDEVEQAARLALRDPQVVRLFGGRVPAFRVPSSPAMLAGDQPRIEGLRTIGATRDDPCYRRRCIVLFFFVDNQYVQVNRVFVDLNSQRVFIREGL